MNDLKLIQTGEIITADSRDVAENFEKNHRDVLKAIDVLQEGMRKNSQTPEEFFIPSNYTHEQNGQTYRNYLLTRNGFSLLVMGFTGDTALQWQLKYIDAFNKMEKALAQPFHIPATYQEALRLAADQAEMISKQKQYIKEAQPAVLFAKSVQTAQTSILIGELAKILKQNGVDIGQNRLFTRLREDGYLIKRRGFDYNMPTQAAMEKGLFDIKETAISHADGHTTISKTPKVTGRGQIYFVNKFLKGVTA